MNWPQWITQEKLTVAAISAVVLAIGGTYQLQQGRIADRDRDVEIRDKEIASLKEAKVWNVPDTIEKLKDISQKLQAQFASVDELNSLRKDNEALRLRSTSLEKANEEQALKLKDLSGQNVALKISIEKMLLPSQQIDLEAGSGADLVKNNLTLGVGSVYTSSISGRLRNEPLSMDVGENVNIRVLGKDCRLALLKTKYNVASFSFVCPQGDGVAEQ
ncbi:hypothetical protein [Pseudomonas sp. BF-RE-26]|uniref:hypothetical protein n=1 Tax=Pseudomonas sp. BF-RE-26 TaxID=2832396 RepID=UPI001CC13A35|nr:hypothetical protein [Pseudomonas sp. BF-RE-26]